MQINVTVCIQALNFFVAYIILRTLLFKPVVAAVEHEHAEQKKLQGRVETQEKKIEKKEQEKIEKWYVSQHDFAQAVPQLGDEQLYIFKYLASDVTLPEVDQKSESELRKEMARALIDKVDHVH